MRKELEILTACGLMGSKRPLLFVKVDDCLPFIYSSDLLLTRFFRADVSDYNPTVGKSSILPVLMKKDRGMFG